MANIKAISGQKIFNSQGEPTLEVKVELTDGQAAHASVPTGALISKYEAIDQTNLAKAIDNINHVISDNLQGKDPARQAEIDQTLLTLDSTSDKQNLGGNTLLGVSLACSRAGALSLGKPLYLHLASLFDPQNSFVSLPIPMINLINGGVHANNNLLIQDFMVVSLAERASFSQRLEAGVKIFHTLEKQLKKIGKSINVGYEGGFAPQLNSNQEALELIVEAIQGAGFNPGQDAAIAIDVAAEGIPQLEIATYPLSPLDYYQKICQDYPVTILEDPFDQDDWPRWVGLTERIGSKVLVVGDDLFCTNLRRLKEGIIFRAANGISIKPNQIGTLSETFEVIQLARKHKLDIQISHRAGETEDSFIADLAVAVKASYLKAGAPNRGERVAKYNRLLEIELELEKKPSN